MRGRGNISASHSRSSTASPTSPPRHCASTARARDRWNPRERAAGQRDRALRASPARILHSHRTSIRDVPPCTPTKAKSGRCSQTSSATPSTLCTRRRTPRAAQLRGPGSPHRTEGVYVTVADTGCGMDEATQPASLSHSSPPKAIPAPDLASGSARPSSISMGATSAFAVASAGAGRAGGHCFPHLPSP